MTSAFSIMLLSMIFIALSMKRHFKQITSLNKIPSLRLLLNIRYLGYAGLSLALIIFVDTLSIGLGLVTFFALITFIAFVQILIMTYQPKILLPLVIFWNTGSFIFHNL